MGGERMGSLYLRWKGRESLKRKEKHGSGSRKEDEVKRDAPKKNPRW